MLDGLWEKQYTLDKQGVVIDMPTWDASWLGSET
jgi:hypothetical protein